MRKIKVLLALVAGFLFITNTSIAQTSQMYRQACCPKKCVTELDYLYKYSIGGAGCSQSAWCCEDKCCLNECSATYYSGLYDNFVFDQSYVNIKVIMTIWNINFKFIFTQLLSLLLQNLLM
jgi:hypothetical protein